MARAKTDQSAAAESAPAASPTQAAGGARTAVTLEQATKIGLFGQEVDGTDDTEYTSTRAISAAPEGDDA